MNSFNLIIACGEKCMKNKRVKDKPANASIESDFIVSVIISILRSSTHQFNKLLHNSINFRNYYWF